jgi:hypothetical protein
MKSSAVGRIEIGNKYEQIGPLDLGPSSVRPAAWAIFGWCRNPGAEAEKGATEVSGIAKLWPNCTHLCKKV